MIYFNRGDFKFKGDKVELMADLSTLLQHLVDTDVFDIEDVMKIMTLSLENSGVKVIQGEAFDDIEDFKDFLDSMDCSETEHAGDYEECDYCSHREECRDDNHDDVDEIFDFLRKKPK